MIMSYSKLENRKFSKLTMYEDEGGKRRRVPTGSPQGQNTAKSLRQESPETAKQRKEAWEENIENANLDSNSSPIISKSNKISSSK